MGFWWGGIRKEKRAMIWSIAAILLAIWLVGLTSSYTLAGFLHVLLVVAVVLILFNLAVGRRPLRPAALRGRTPGHGSCG
jgi:hypothetical protein